MIRIDQLSHTYTGRRGPVEALRHVTLQVDEGEFVAILGQSGCGKSTLLRLVAGLTQPTAGTVTINGTRVGQPRPDVAMVFQRPALLPWRSVQDNIQLAGKLLHLPKAECRRYADELLELTGLHDIARRLPHELSGGMQQRVALCRALLTRPRAMLMDEPFSALDVLTREQLSVQLQRIHMQLTTTVLYVTHSIDEAVLLADRVVVLSPRPGQPRTTVRVDVPRPRTLGRHPSANTLAELRAELHELLAPEHA